jgi:hypothetical protein
MMKRAGGGMLGRGRSCEVCACRTVCPRKKRCAQLPPMLHGRSTAVDTEGGKSFRRIRLTLLLRPLKVDF